MLNSQVVDSKPFGMPENTNQRQFAVDIVSKLRAAGYTALFAGGCVRDSMLGRPSKDYDVATTALPEQVRTLFGHRKTLAVGASFGVIVVIGPPDIGHVEVATFRTEGPYLDGRRPESVQFCTPEEDAHRRDFTINGMFIDPISNQVLDYVGGQADLTAKIIRAIGDPHDRVREDKLRMLRAVRFSATLGFSLDPTTADAVREMSAQLIVVSAERIAQELKKMLVDAHRRQAIDLLELVHLRHIILPELDSLVDHPGWQQMLKRLEFLPAPSFELAFSALMLSVPAASVNEVCRRLKLSNDETDRIVWLIAHQSDLDDASKLSLAELKRCLGHPYHHDLLELLRASRTAVGGSLESVRFCERFLERTPAAEINPPPLVTGDDLVALGMRPGPKFKTILDSIRVAQLNLEISTREEGIALAMAASAQ